MSQPSLFDEPDDEYPARDFAAVEPDTHAANLARVRGKIGETVAAFLRGRLAEGRPVFVIAELFEFVAKAHGVAPASPDRILRDGRQRRLYGYEVLSRRQSRYRVLWVGPPAVTENVS